MIELPDDHHVDGSAGLDRRAEIKVFSEAEYRADPAKVIALAAIEGRVMVARADGSPRFMIAIPPPE